MNSRLLIPIFLAASALSAQAASFDCKLAKSPREKAVCSDARLSAEDSAVAEAYTHLRARLSPASAVLVQSDQRAWLAYLDRACPPAVTKEGITVGDCLAEEYTGRKNDLLTSERLPSGHTLFTRGVYLIAPWKPTADDNCPRNPGFGTGSFGYPQIDTPTPAEEAFNAASLHSGLAVFRDGNHTPANFRAATENDAEVTLSYTVASSNTHFLSVSWSFGTEPYCAAHPLYDESSFSFSLDKARALTPSDVFSTDTATTRKLAQLVSARLSDDKDRAASILDDEKAKGIPQALADPDQWLLSPDGFEIRFHRYQVAAYVAGSPVVHLRWSELQPLLNPAFRPETLPALRKSALDE